MKSDLNFHFVFGETHLKAKPANMDQRIRDCTLLKKYMDGHFHGIPVFIGGDFNEEP